MKLSFKLICALVFLYSSPALCMKWFAKLCGSCAQQEVRVAPVRNAWANKYEVTTDEVKTSDEQLSIAPEQAEKNNALSELIVYDTKKVGIQKLLYDLITTLPKELIGMIVAYYHIHIPEGKLVKTVSMAMDEYDYIRYLSALSDDMLAVVTCDNNLHIVDCNEGVCVKTYKSENFKWFGSIRNIVEAGDGVIAFVSGQQLGLLDITTNKCVWYKVPFDEQHSHVELFPSSASPKGWLAIAARHDDDQTTPLRSVCCDTVALFNLNTKQWSGPFTGKFPCGTRMAFLTPERMAFSRSFWEGINFIDVKTGVQKHAQQSRKGFGDPFFLRLSDNLLVATEWGEESIKMWDARTGAQIKSIQNTDIHHHLIVHPSNLLIVDPVLKLFNPVTGSTVGEFKIDGTHMTALSSGRLATVVGNEVKIWE